MRFLSGTTKNEQKLVRGIQAAVGAVQDNSIGQQTLTDLACVLHADVFPLCVDIFGYPVMIAHDLRPAAVSAPLKNYANAISGSFSWKGKPCSILVSDGSAVATDACHYWTLGSPESVLYRTQDGKYGIRRCHTVKDLPSGTRWAIGGMGLLGNYAPAAEGFIGQYADVLRKTAHTFVGVKHGMVYLGYVSGMTGAQVNAHAQKLRLDHAILLDGGHVAAINAAESKINTGERQFYIIQAI